MKPVIVLACAALAATPCFAANAAAPDSAQKARPQIQNFGDWDTRCFPVKSDAPCDVFFATASKKTGQRVSSVSISYAPKQNGYMMQVAVPLGISIPDGLVISAGTFTSAKLDFRRCDEGGCYIERKIGTGLIDALKGAGDSDSHLAVVTADGRKLSLPLSLKGFGDAFADMVKKATDKTKGS